MEPLYFRLVRRQRDGRVTTGDAFVMNDSHLIVASPCANNPIDGAIILKSNVAKFTDMLPDDGVMIFFKINNNLTGIRQLCVVFPDHEPIIINLHHVHSMAYPLPYGGLFLVPLNQPPDFIPRESLLLNRVMQEPVCPFIPVPHAQSPLDPIITTTELQTLSTADLASQVIESAVQLCEQRPTLIARSSFLRCAVYACFHERLHDRMNEAASILQHRIENERRIAEFFRPLESLIDLLHLGDVETLLAAYAQHVQYLVVISDHAHGQGPVGFKPLPFLLPVEAGVFEGVFRLTEQIKTERPPPPQQEPESSQESAHGSQTPAPNADAQIEDAGPAQAGPSQERSLTQDSHASQQSIQGSAPSQGEYWQPGQFDGPSMQVDDPSPRTPSRPISPVDSDTELVAHSRHSSMPPQTLSQTSEPATPLIPHEQLFGELNANNGTRQASQPSQEDNNDRFGHPWYTTGTPSRQYD